MDVIRALSKVSALRIRNDDDFCDRLSHRFTTFMLIILALVVSTKQYVGEPITCWVPAHFTHNHEEYTNKVCWISNTYYQPFEEDIPKAHEPRRFIGYYQWVPLFLFVQALMFYIPCIVWRVFNDKSGINVHNIVEATETIQNALHYERRDQLIKYVARHLDRYLDNQREYRKRWCVNLKHFIAKNCCLICGKRYGNYLVVLYLVVKTMYIANVIGQLFMLNAFLGTEYHVYGIEVIRDLINGDDWSASERFPRVTLCDFKIRQLGNVHRHTVQCVLPINLFNEKVFIFMWFWFVFVAGVSVGSICLWTYKLIFRYDRVRYIRKYLKVMDRLDRETDKKLSYKFADNYLRQDGIFVLRLLANNCSDVVVAEIVCALWDNYKHKRPFPPRNNIDDSEV